jgi:spermidine synthase
VQIRRERAIQALLPLFFLSGATALAYQTVWVRELQLVFGTSTFAISTVLASFMGGLAIGGFLMARIADKVARPLAAYGAFEIGIGLYAVVFPIIVGVVTPAYLGVWRALEPGPVLFGLVQFAFVGSTLLLPTAAMGATLPLLARFATLRLGAAGERVGTLYAVNTAGAVAGTILCGFVLLPTLGREQTTWLAASANLALGFGAIALDRWAHSTEHTPVVDDVDERPDAAALATLRVVVASIALAGFSALIYEVAWTRVLGLMLGGSTYTFSVMLVAFLTGIALGGRLGGPLADRWLASGGVRRVLLWFAAIEVAIAVVSYLLMYVYPELPFVYVWLFDAFDTIQRPRATFAVSLAVAALVMTPPAVLMGMHFPVAVRAVVGHGGRLGAPVGLVYGANTLGGVFGAFLAGFVFLPNLWVQGTMFVAACAELLAAALLVVTAMRGAGQRWVFAAPVGLLAIALLFVARKPPWDPMLMTAGMYHYVSHFEDHTREGIENYTLTSYEMLYYEEGLSSVVTVAKNRDSNNRWLANNGKVDASTTSDMPTQVLCSLLPIQFVDDPKDVLVIGLASGITAGAVSLVPDVETLEVVELEPAIRRAARWFDQWNHHVLDDPRLHLVQNDGRNHVLLAPEHSYDVIVSEPSNPWISGVSNLFTKDFLEIGKTRLKPGGVWSQWVQMYGMDSHDLRILLKTFADVYPHVLVFATIEDADLVLVGSESPLVPTEQSALKLLGWPLVRRELKQVDIRGPFDLISLYQFGRDAIVEFSADLPLNTDDNMIIEYGAPLNLHTDTSTENYRLLLENARVPEEGMGNDADRWARLAHSYHEREDPVRAVMAVARALELLGPDDPRRQQYRRDAARWTRELEELQAPEEPEEEEGS